jgi:DNA topoisomerase-1
VATGRDFGSDGVLRARDVLQLDDLAANVLAAGLRAADFAVRSVERKPYRRSPYAPFRTTTLQQEASRKLGFGAARTMRVAQRLYENGYITYMRTDSTTLSATAIEAARAQVRELYGPEYLPDAPRKYDSKVRSAQEAHEAIRPAGDAFRTPAQTRLSGDEFRLYELIWMRTVASQMPDARGRSLTLRLAGTSSAGEQAVFRASGRTFEFLGFRMAYVDVSEEPETEDGEANLPAVGTGEGVACEEISASGHSTQPPARYTEASLVKELEDRAIGRPSTYASIINTITNERGYVWKKGNALVPSWTAFAKTQLLERYFPHLVDYDFTATMEEALDEVAAGRAESEKWLHAFYYGNGTAGLHELVSEENLAKIDMSEVNAIHIDGGGDTGRPEIVVRVWNTGESLHRGDEKCPLPADMAPDELTVERAEELLARGAAGPRELGVDPATGQKVLALNGRFGPFVQLGELEEGSKAKPPRASLFKSMEPESVDLETALQLLSLPRVVGQDAEGAEITAQNGRYGPYLKKGTDSRSLESESQIFDITLEGAEAIFAQPKQRRGQAKPPIAELGTSPDTEKPVRVLDGRFGPYVTDGTTNATVPRGLDPAAVTLVEAIELLRERAAKGPTKKKVAKRKTTKKATKKKATKKATKKQATKKAAAKAAGGRAGTAASAAPGPEQRVAPRMEPSDSEPATP